MKKSLKGGRKKKIKFEFTGNIRQDDLLIGSHGDTSIKIHGNFQLSGIVYCPKYTITLNINGEGRVSFRGKCQRIVIKKMQGDCTLDLSDVTYRELQCESILGKSIVIAGNARAITPAILGDEATLHIQEGQLLFNPVTSGNARIIAGKPPRETEQVDV